MGNRVYSRVISIFGLIVATLGTLINLLEIVLIVTEFGEINQNETKTALNETKSDLSNTDDGDDAGLTALQWATYTLEITCYILLIYGAWRLLKGTAKSISPVDGLRHCRIWRGITIFYTVIRFIDIIYKFIIGYHWMNSSFDFLYCIFNIFSIIFVQKYMKELTSSLLTSTGGSNTGAQCYYPNVK